MRLNTIVNKNILVTGATSGIGKCLTLKLIDEGANVAFCGRSENKMTQLVAEIKNTKSKCYYKAFDVSNEDDIIGFVKDASIHLGQLDILVNCAGANTARAFVADIKTVDLEWMLRVNTIAPFIFMREVYKSMNRKKAGQFINVLSTVCNFSNEGIGAYTASKSGFNALVNVFRKEVRDSNIKVCSIFPGGVDTPFREAIKPEYLDPENVAETIMTMMLFDDNTSIDELVIRPLIEKNYS